MTRGRALAALAGVGGILAAAALVPRSLAAGASPLCLFHALTGLRCPGCGLARGLTFLVQGDVRTATLFHPLVGLALAGLVAAGARLAFQAAGRRRPLPALSRPAERGLLVLVAAAFVAAWALRAAGVFSSLA